MTTEKETITLLKSSFVMAAGLIEDNFIRGAQIKVTDLEWITDVLAKLDAADPEPNTITLPRDVVEGLLETIEELVSDPNRNTSHKIAMLAVRFLKVKAAFKEAGE